MRRPATAAAVLVAAAAAGVVLAPPAAADGERMHLLCQDGRVIERTNGSSWWDVGSGTVLLSERLVVERDGDVVYAKDYGRKAPDADRSTCVAEHFGSTWTVDLVTPR